MDSKLRLCLAELLGTFTVVLVGAGTVCASALRLPALPETAPALAEGFTLAVVLTVTFYVSPGCLNPAITIMLWVFKRLDNATAGWLVLMQLLGSCLAGLVLRLLFEDTILVRMQLGVPHLKALNPNQDPLTASHLATGMAYELFFACLVTLAAFATLFDRRAPRLGGLLVGLAQCAVILFGFRLTGGAANPARWLGPALWQGTVPGAPQPTWLPEIVIYAGGPILGALLAALLYGKLILPPEKGMESLR